MNNETGEGEIKKEKNHDPTWSFFMPSTWTKNTRRLNTKRYDNNKP